MAAAQSSRRAPSTAVQLRRAVRRITRVSGHHVLYQTVSSLLARCLARGDVVVGVIATLQTVSLAGTPAAGRGRPQGGTASGRGLRRRNCR